MHERKMGPGMRSADRAGRCDVIVVGAGFAGLYALFRMRQLGFSVHAFEAGSEVGGVWYWNRYPGARCDVESMQYSYSFSEELQQQWRWTERFAPQAEILDYIKHVADRFDLRRDIQFDTRVTAAAFDEAESLWAIRTDRGDVVRARFCIMASGPLSAARMPDIKGIESFPGPCLHRGAWPSLPVSFAGKRVGVIGTGSSGVQVVPVIAREAAHLTVFQRTASFVVPARNRPLDPVTEQRWKANYAAHRQRAREVGTFYEFSDRAALSVPAEERQREYERRWAEGGVNFVHSFNDIYTSKPANDTAADVIRRKIGAQINDPVLREKLTPQGHPYAVRRPSVDSGYFQAFNRDNVELADIREFPIVEFTAEGIRTTDKLHTFDMIILATGFDAFTGSLLKPEIVGRNGLTLKQKWADGPVTQLGVASAGFPNLLIVAGPGSPSLLSNVMVSIEEHTDWLVDLIRDMDAHGQVEVEATHKAEAAWVEHVNERVKETLYLSTNSYYNGAEVPGKPRVFMPYSGGVRGYRRILQNCAAAGYEGFDLRTVPAKAKRDTAVARS
jgi:cyclohexanone monooxygenase